MKHYFISLGTQNDNISVGAQESICNPWETTTFHENLDVVHYFLKPTFFDHCEAWVLPLQTQWLMRIQLLVTLSKRRQDVMHQMPARRGKIHMSNASNRRQDTIHQMQAWIKTENSFRKLGYPKWTLTDNVSTLTLLDIFLLGLLKMTSLTPLMNSKETADGGSHQFLWTCYSCALANLGNCIQLCITGRGLDPPVRGPLYISFDTTYYCFVW